MAAWRKLGIIAGGGELPVVLAEHCAATSAPYFVARISPYADAALEAHPGATHGLGAMGARMEAMRDGRRATRSCSIGQVPRPDFATLKLDDGAKAMLPAIARRRCRKGDDALLRALLERARARRLPRRRRRRGDGAICSRPPALGARIAPSAAQMKPTSRKARAGRRTPSARSTSARASSSCDGLVLAVEAQEGTDAMLRARRPHLPRRVARHSAERAAACW